MNVEERIEFDCIDTSFGECLVAGTEKGICELVFTDGKCRAALSSLQQHYPHALLIHASGAFANLEAGLFDGAATQWPLDIRGTEFQQTVWTELLTVPNGEAISYQSLAARLGRPQAARAVATAVAHNRIAILVPCHRIIRKDGSLGGYRWGAERKAALLSHERSACLI